LRSVQEIQPDFVEVGQGLSWTVEPRKEEEEEEEEEVAFMVVQGVTLVWTYKTV
jgi:hypothetical protein